MLPVILASAAPAWDRDRLERLYTQYYPLMLSVAMKVLHEPESARDAVHEAVLKIIPQLGRLDAGDPLTVKSYLCVTVKHCAIDLLRREEFLPREDADEAALSEEDDTPSPAEYVVSEDGYAFLLRCIGSLSDTCRTVCQLKYVSGLTEAEIAGLLKLSPKAVNSRIMRGKQMLKKMIRESGYYGEHYGKEKSE